ncbi:IclR family transcriptional regulator [Roseovarius salinarum]|uniref:IclR family transcriptional regulator n=1 Tax=Roseovarius salinarum TaxID=1981892 RepID=UPI0018E45498|nr:IclR family transcriptional regulator [Roseovarius salinarum]
MKFSDASSTRALRLFECFAQEGTPLSLSEIAKLMDTPISTCHALVAVLREGGYLYTNRRTKRFYPTKRLLRLARSIAAEDPMVSYFEPYLRQLGEATRETVILGTRQDDSVVYLDVIEGPQVIRYSAEPGDIKPLHSSAIGKLVLGEMPDEERARVLDRLSLDKVTDNTVVEKAALDAQLRDAHAAGVYLTSGENVSDVMAAAIPVVVYGELFGVAVAGPRERMKAGYDAVQAALMQVGQALKTDFE